MPIVAVPGGSSPGLGRSIVTALHTHPSHTPIVLSRTTSPTPRWLLDLSIEVRKVDYTSHDSLVTALTGVHTIITTLLALGPEAVSIHRALLTAGLSVNISRFVPAEFASGHRAAYSIPFFASHLEVRDMLRAAQATRPGFEWGAFHVGMFMNYLGFGAPREEEALMGRTDDGKFLFQWPELRVHVPLTKEGEVPRITLTDLGSVGRYVAAACDLPMGGWREDMSVVGETMGIDEIVGVFERVSGRKVEMVLKSVEKVEREHDETVQRGDDWEGFVLDLERSASRNEVGEAVLEPVVNRLCPEVEPMGIEEYFERFWRV